MQDWASYKSWLVDVLKWEIEEAFRTGKLALWLKLSTDYYYYMQDLTTYRQLVAAMAKAAADAKAAKDQEDSDLADEFAYQNDVDAFAEQKALVDELAIEMGYPPDGSYAGIVNSILNIFQQPQPAPQPTAQFASPTPLGELIAPILALFPSREQADSTSKS